MTPKGYVCYRAETPPQINGRLDDPMWDAAPWTDDFADIEGDAQPRPRFRTRAKMLWDDDFFYIGAELEEPNVWATLTEHDSIIFQDNDFEVFIDPDGDNHDYYELEINALNTTWDLRLVKPYRDGGPALNEWEIPGMRTAVHIDGTLSDPTDTDRGWSLTLALPWAALGQYARRTVPPSDGDQWRVNFSRVEWDVEVRDGVTHKIPDRPEHNWVWSPQGVIDMHRPEHWGYVQFSTKPPGAVPFRPDPSLPARETLMRLYYAQRAYHQTHGRWAAALSDLPTFGAGAMLPDLRLTAEGFEASMAYLTAEATPRRLHVRADSRLWEDAQG